MTREELLTNDKYDLIMEDGVFNIVKKVGVSNADTK